MPRCLQMISRIRHKAGSFKSQIFDIIFDIIIVKFLKFFGVWHNFFQKKNCQRLFFTDRRHFMKNFLCPMSIIKNQINRTRSCPLSLIAPHIFPRRNSPLLPTQAVTFQILWQPPPPLLKNTKLLFQTRTFSHLNVRCPYFLNLFEMCLSLSINSLYFKLRLFDQRKILVWSI